MAEKKDCFIKGRIYIGVAEPLPSGTYSYNHAIPKWEEKIKGLTSYPVTGTHSFKNGQDVTGFWKLQHQRMHFDADEWEDCSELAYERGSKYDFQVIAITIPPVSPPDELDREVDLKKAWNAFRMRGFPHNTDNYGNETFEQFLKSLQSTKVKVNKCRCEKCSGIALMEEYASQFQHPVPDEAGEVYVWVKCSDRMPDKNGYYITEAEWTGDNSKMILPTDRSDTYFQNGKFDDTKGWTSFQWLEKLSLRPSQPAAVTNLALIHKGIEFSKTLLTESETYLSGAAFGYSCGYQAASQPAGNDAVRLIKELLMLCEDDRSVVEGFRTKEIILEMKTLTR